MGTMSNAGLFLVTTLFDLYLLVLVVRLILAYSRANYFNPVTQVIIKLTQPLVAPLRKVIPNYKGIEFATLLLIIVFEIIKILLIRHTLKLILNTFFYAILIQVLLSWIQPGNTPATQLLSQITAPIMRPMHRLVPPIGGMDLSPIPALIILQLLVILLP